MIASVRGPVRYVGASSAIIEVGGLGLRVNATPGALAGLREGSEGQLFTTLVVREDSLTLFGFATADERDIYEILQSVSGIGPKVALAMLATLTPDALRSAVQNEDVAALQRVPGVGKKSASRMVLELGSKLGPAVGSSPAGAPAPAAAAVNSDVVEALVGLGWSDRDAGEAVSAAASEQPEASTQQLLRLSLQILGRRK